MNSEFGINPQFEDPEFPEETCQDRYYAEIASLNSISNYLLTLGFNIEGKPMGFLPFIQSRMELAERQISQEDVPRLRMISKRFNHQLPVITEGLQRFRVVTSDAAFTKLADSRERKDQTHYNTPEAIGPRFEGDTLYRVTQDFLREYKLFKQELVDFLDDRREEFYQFTQDKKVSYNPVLNGLLAHFDDAILTVADRLSQTKTDLGRLLHYPK